MEDRKSQILNALKEERRMTQAQLARIAYQDLKRPLVISSGGSQHHYPAGYQVCGRLLQKMWSDKDERGKRQKPLIRRHVSPYHGYPDLYMLPETKQMKFDLYQHEIICADVYVAYRSVCTGWCEPVGDNLKALKLEPDRYMKIYGTDVFIEADRGTEGPSIIREKLEKYLRYEAVTGRRFNVVFVLQDYKKDRDLRKIADPAQREELRLARQRRRGVQIETEAEALRRGNQFLFTCQDWIEKFPHETILASPLGTPLSFKDLSK